MGVGNWFPSIYDAEDVEYRMVYVVDDEIDMYYLVEFLINLLPDSFYEVNGWDYREGFIEQMYILAENQLMHLVMHEWHTYIAICFIPRTDAPSFKDHAVHKLSKKVFDALADEFELRVRSGPWTSAPYTK